MACTELYSIYFQFKIGGGGLNPPNGLSSAYADLYLTNKVIIIK